VGIYLLAGVPCYINTKVGFDSQSNNKL